MSKGWRGAILRTLGASEHLLTVTGRQFLAPHLLRIHFACPTLLKAQGEAPGAWVRAWFPDPAGGRREYQRGYTLSQSDPAAGTCSIDFVIHQPLGPAAHWALHCAAGDELAVMRLGERPFAPLSPAPAGYLLLGDLAAYPAITQVAAAVAGQAPVVAVLESSSPDDALLPLPSGEGITATWVEHRTDGRALASALEGRDWSGWSAWVTAETTATKHARALLKKQHGLEASHLHAQAYWVAGRQMGKAR